MKNERILRVSASDLKAGDTDWARVDALTEADIEKAIAEDPDAAPILDEAWFQGAVVGVPAKVAMSIRVDDDVMEWFRAQGKGWQTRMNAILRAYAKAQGGVK